MNRNDIPTFMITKPGEYETRGGTKAVVEFRTNLPDALYPWVGYCDFAFQTWNCKGQSDTTATAPPYDIVGPWIEGGLPFDEVLNPATSSPELLQRFEAARDARMPIEVKLRESDAWEVIDKPLLNTPKALYRIKGSAEEVLHLDHLTREDVREIVKEVLKEMLT